MDAARCSGGMSACSSYAAGARSPPRRGAAARALARSARSRARPRIHSSWAPSILWPAQGAHALRRWHPSGVVRGRPAYAILAFLAASTACEPAAVVTTPSGPATSTCPLGGCGRAGDGRDASALPASLVACSSAGDAPCSGAAAADCTERALAAWSEATDDREVACVARMLSESCALDEPRACGISLDGLWLDGRGVAGDAQARASRCSSTHATAGWRWRAP